MSWWKSCIYMSRIKSCHGWRLVCSCHFSRAAVFVIFWLKIWQIQSALQSWHVRTFMSRLRSWLYLFIFWLWSCRSISPMSSHLFLPISQNKDYAVVQVPQRLLVIHITSNVMVWKCDMYLAYMMLGWGPYIGDRFHEMARNHCQHWSK
jgi:hypothetical protein